MRRDVSLIILAFVVSLFILSFSSFSEIALLCILLVVVLGIYFSSRRRYHNRIAQQEYNYVSQIRSSSKDIELKSRQLLSLTSNIPSPLALLDAEGNIAMFNESFSRFLSEDDSEHLRYDDIRLEGDIRLFSKEAYLNETSLIRVIDFNSIDYQALSIPVHENNRFAGCVLVFQDVTQAMERERIQKRFIADASHELKTPITAILGMVELLNREDFHDDAAKKEFLLDIEKETKRLHTIVQDLLQLSKLSSSKPILRKEQVNLEDMIQDIKQTVRPLLDEKKLEMICINELEDSVIVDSVKMREALNNLVVNAIKYTDSGTITIHLYETIKDICIAVSDTGIGLREEDIQHIFERFYRPDTNRSRMTGGSGLGLAIVKATVDAHNGSIEVESKEQKGSTFTIYLPK